MKRILCGLLLLLPGLASTQAQENPGLKDIATFPVGSALEAPGGGVLWEPDAPLYDSIVKSQFSSTTANNSMKWGSLHANQGSYDFTMADRLKNYALANSIRLHGHNLIWQLSAKEISWINNFTGDSAAFAAMVKDHIYKVVSHFKGVAVSWDVVNEPIRSDGMLRDASDASCAGGDCYGSIFYKKLGKNYLDLVFTWAHEADSSALLFLNEYALEDNDVKLQGLIDIAMDMKSRGIPIHGLGTQLHMSVNTPNAGLENMFRKLGATGFAIHVSELDIAVNESNDPNYVYDAGENFRQAEKYRFVAEAYQRFVPPANRFGITVWGFNDFDTWIRGYFGRYNDWPCIYGTRLEAKPAWQGLAAGLNFLNNQLLPGRVQAENYSYATGGSKADSTDEDLSATLMGLQAGDTLRWNLKVLEAAAFRLRLRISNESTDSSELEIHTPSGYTQVFKVPPTGDDSNFVSLDLPLEIPLSDGWHELSLKVHKGIAGINWFEAYPVSIPFPGRIQAENWLTVSGATRRDPSDRDGSATAGYTAVGQYTEYKVYNSSEDTLYLSLRALRSAASEAEFLLKNGDQLLTAIRIPFNGGQWSTVRIRIALPKGLLALRLQNNSASFTQINWLDFSAVLDVPGKIEAEYGINLQATSPGPSDDTDGSGALAFTQAGGRVMYPVKMHGQGRFAVQYRVKGKGTLSLKSGEQLLHTIDLFQDGDSLKWKTLVGLAELSSNAEELSIEITGNASINWFQLSKYIALPGKIEAEDYFLNKGTRVGSSNDADGSPCLSYLAGGDYTDYLVDVKMEGEYAVVARASRGINGTASLQVKQGSTLLGTVTIGATGSWTVFSSFTTTVTLKPGIQVIRLAYPNGGFNLNWVEISSSRYYPELMDSLQYLYRLLNGAYTIGGGSESSILSTKTFENFESKATVTDFDIVDQSFTRGTRVEVYEKPSQAWSESVFVTNGKPVKKTNTYLAVFNIRCASCITAGSKALVDFSIKNNNNPWNQEYSKGIYATSDWKRYYLPCLVKNDYALNSVRMHFVMGAAVQTIELAGLALVDYGTSYTVTEVQNKLKNPNLEAGIAPAEVLLAYPNPTNGVFYLRSDELNSLRVRIFNTQGRLVMQQDYRAGVWPRIDLGTQPDGLYLLHVTSGSRQWSEKIFLAR